MTVKTLLIAAALVTLPATAQAYCAGSAAGSAVQSCEEGVRVIRNTPLPLPRISHYQAAKLDIQRDRLALDRQRAANSFALQSRRLDQKARVLNQRDYLYRDANSPLRRGHGVNGFGYGLTAGPVVGRTGFVGGFTPARARH